METKKKILVIDDEPPYRELLKTILEKNNFIVFDVPDGQEANIVLQSIDKIDLVITDLMMPGEHGIDVMIRIKKDYKVPVLVISGVYDKEMFEEEGIRFSDGFLKKPIETNELLNIVAMLTQNE